MENTNPISFVTLSSDEALRKLESPPRGLSSDEVAKRRIRFGENTIKSHFRFGWSEILLRQFKDIFIWILLTAAFFSFLFQEFRDTTIILIIVIINAAIGFIQEYKAERVLDRLRELETDWTIVFRDGEKREVEAKTLVPGDIISLSAGAIVPADVRLIESFAFKVNTAIFTGESSPKKRDASPSKEAPRTLADAENIVLTGESVISGEARAIVISIGNTTELGRLAAATENIKDDPTPLQKKMKRLGNGVALLSIVIGIVVIFLGRNAGLLWYDTFLLALALAVSIVPEGLPAAVSVAFALGMKRLLRSNILAKKLSAVETLGSVTTICTDKTGTVTAGELTVTKIVLGERIYDISGEGYEPIGGFFLDGKALSPASIQGAEMLFRIGVLANDASLILENKQHRILGDTTEGAILVASRKYHPDPDFFRIGETKISEIPFSSERMRMSALYRGSSVQSFVKGSPDILIQRCSHRLENGQEIEFTPEEKDRARSYYDSLSKNALRILAFAYRNLDRIPENERAESMENELVWVGMMGMVDPPRPGTRNAIDECRTLGIRVSMITGDYEITAGAVARAIGLISDDRPFEIINGNRLEKLSDGELAAFIRDRDTVFARTTPEQKLRIAGVLKNFGEIVAMTGDGVNDAPALKKADIGIAMGKTGTDVSKEAADMILLDDHFSGIVNGIREGRTIFSNLKKSVHYVFTSNVSELFTVILGFALGIPAPILAIQILAIDLGTDVFPSLALGVEPPEPNRTNAKNTASILDWKGAKRLIKLGMLMAMGGIIAFLLSLLRGGWHWGELIAVDSALYQKSTAATYTTLALTQMANLLQSRSAVIPFFSLPFFSNIWIWVSLAGSVFLLWAFTSTPFLQSLLGMQTPDILDWATALSITLIIFVSEEFRKRGLLRKNISTTIK